MGGLEAGVCNFFLKCENTGSLVADILYHTASHIIVRFFCNDYLAQTQGCISDLICRRAYCILYTPDLHCQEHWKAYFGSLYGLHENIHFK